MRNSHWFSAIAALGAFNASHAQVTVPTYHNDAVRSGQNIQETLLTPVNVNTNQFGKLFSVAVDGQVYAQPLYLSGVNIAGGTHNVVYVATEHDSVYAIDADSGTVYSQVSLIPANGTTMNSASDLGAGCNDLVPEVGITGTPIIDTTSGTLYVVAVSKVNGVFYQYLHALDVTSLKEKLNGPVSIQATVVGSGYDSIGGLVTFNTQWSHQRAALLLEGGHVVISWGSHCDYDPWHGWVMAYNAGTLAQEAALNASPNDSRSGIWMSGSGPAADSAGNIYFATGNGSWNGTTDFGDSIVKLGPPAGGQFPLLDYFTPYNQGTLDADDIDVASGGLLLLPPLPSGQQLLAQQSKQGTVYLLNTNNLGKYCVNLTPACTASDPQIAQEIMGASAGVWGAPAYWNGNLYWGASNEPLRAYSFNAGGSGLMSTSPTSQSPQTFGYPGSTPSVSANGTTNGIVWALAASTSTLYAYDATNLKNLLYTSAQAANNRDATGATVKFVPPIIANGKVYLGTQGALVAYGLLNASLPVAASPTLSPPPGSYTSAQSVTLTDTTPGAVLYYTTNGTTPTLNSAQYIPGAPVSISSTTTLEAIAVASGYQSSPVTTGAYSINAQGTSSISVNLATVDAVDGIANTGTAPTGGGMDTDGYAYSATLLGTSLNWGGSTFTFGAAGVADAVSGTPIALPPGNDSTLNLLATSVDGAQLAQSFVVTYTDGTTSTFKQNLSDWFDPQNFAGESQALKMAYRIAPSGATSPGPVYLYGYSFALNSAKTVQSLTLPNNRHIVVLAVDVSPTGSAPPPAASPTLSPLPGSYPSAQSVTLTDTTPGAVIYYTTNGTTPSASSAKYSPGTPVSISSTTMLEAIAVASGFSNSAVSGGTYTIGSQGTTPISVTLAAVDDVDGIANTGTAPTGGGIDTDGYAYAATLLGTSLGWGGSTFTFGAVGVADAVSGTPIALPPGNDSTLNLLATSVDGAQLAQTFVVTYTDGTTSTFKQNLSDWFDPQNFAGESQALKMAYRIAPSGATSAGPVYLYGYSFALNSAKTVQSLTLPNNRHIVVLAVDVSPTGSAPPPAASPALSPPPGSYPSAQSVTLTDTTPGAVIYYTTNGTTPTLNSAQYSPGTPVSISSTATLEAIAVASGYSNSAVSGGTYTIGSQGTTPISVTLAAVDDVHGIANPATAPLNGGLDAQSYAYDASLLGTSLGWGGATFTLGAAGVADAVSGTTIALPPGNDSTVKLLATAVNGAQPTQTFVVTYTDGTTSTFKQNLSDWFYPQNFAGESQALKMAYRIAPSGATSAGPVYLYGYSFALNSAKTVQSLTLPNNRNVVVLAVDLTP